MFLKCLLLIAGALSSSLVRATQAGLVHSPIKATRGPASLDSRSPNVLILKHGSGTHGSRSSGLLADAMKRTNRDSNTTFLIAEELGSEYVTDIVVGNKTFTVLVDTGSSDLWLADVKYQCVDYQTNQNKPQSFCNLGSNLYTPAPTFSRIPDVEFNITYGTTSTLTGYMGYEDVTVAGITINQQMAVVETSEYVGDGVSVGLLGLSQGPTSAYSNVSNSSVHQHLPYDSILANMFRQNLTPSYFSLALERASSGFAGFLTLGGLPPVRHAGNFTSTPILSITQNTTNSNGSITTTRAYSWYEVEPQAIVYASPTSVSNATSLPSSFSFAHVGGLIVDSGTKIIYVPASPAFSINSLFVPPAIFSTAQGGFVVDCNATAPAVGVQFEGHVFWVDKKDLILAGSEVEGKCTSGVSVGGDTNDDSIKVLGANFLRNVVAVFDVGAGVMKFAARM